MSTSVNPTTGLVGRLVGFCLDNKLIVFLAVVFMLGWGLAVAPFNWSVWDLPRDPVPDGGFFHGRRMDRESTVVETADGLGPHWRADGERR